MGTRRSSSWLSTPAYLAIRGGLAALLTGDVGAHLDHARGLARVYAKLERGRLRRTMDNLGVAFPDMPQDQRELYAIRAYEHLFMLGVEMAYTPRLINRDAWSQHLRLSNLQQSVRLLTQERPCVLITGHCGNWELLGFTMAMLGFSLHALYRPLDLKPLDRWVRDTRARRGLNLIDKFGAASEMPRIMRSNGLVGFIADQNAGDRGLFVPFFNRMASTYKSIGLMAIQYDAPIICGQARRLVPWRDAQSTHDDPGTVGFESYRGEPFRYHIDTMDIIMPEEWKAQPDPLFYVSARYRRSLEMMVRRTPEQNLWLHRYWKSRPRHEHLGKPLPAGLKEKIRALPWMTDDDLARIEDWTARDARELASRPPKPSFASRPRPIKAV